MQVDELDLPRLRSFAAVAETGSVSAAARRLGVTRSAVSQSLAGLEAQLGIPLFHRVGRRLVQTREGELLARRWAEVRAGLQQTLDRLAGEEREARGPVRIGLYVGFPTARLAPLLAAFAAEHPAARPRLRFAAADELAESLLAGRLDFVLALEPRRSDRRLRARKLFEQELVLVAGRAHAGAVRGGVDLSGLRRLPLVDYYRGDPLVARWARHHFRTRAPRLQATVYAATTDLVCELVLRGVGLGVLPRTVAQPHVTRRRLHPVRTGRPELRDAVWLLELRSPRRSRAVEAFRRAAEQAFGGA